MNLGDGLLFELENGKARLVLSKYGAESKSLNHQKFLKSSCQVPSKKKSLRIINSKQGLTRPEKPEQDNKCKDKPTTSYIRQNITHELRKTKNKSWSETSSSRANGVLSDKKENDSHMVTKKKESLVCLTQEQFQQILSTINKTTANDPQTHTEPVASLEENCHTSTTAEEFPLNGSSPMQRVAEVKKNIEHMSLCVFRRLSHEQQSGLFSTFGERERERDALEAQRTEWRRELDEQMALKRKPRANVKSNDKSCEGRLKNTMDEWGTAQTPAEIESSNPKAQIQTHKQLPAAIRSAFILGEAAPMENVVSAQRAEQQRQWLQELDQQREEAKLRRQREKEINSHPEDMERWAVHFDSLHRGVAMASEDREPDISSCLSHRSVSGALSTAWEGISLFGGESLGRASVDTVQGNQQRTSHLRTMTALLDPAQIEEREHRRLKQLEHQRAIEAQVEERRRQKEKEEATRQAHDEEEERRVEIERERLQQQFLKDTERQRHKEELQLRKTEELYLSIQRAQEEAFKDKHLQRIKDLSKKGHNVSRLLRSLEGDSVSQAFSGQDSPNTSTSLISSEVKIQRVEPSTAPSPRKDTAVQTEVSHLLETDAVCDPGKESPNTAVACMAASNTLTSKNSKSSVEKLPEKSYGTVPTEAEADPYEPYARTGRNGKQQPTKKPEWNTQRPSKAFIPASERYPEILQRHRQQNRKHRQMELMTLVEKNTVSRILQQDPLPPPINNNHRLTAQRHINPQKQSETKLQESVFTAERALSPVPAVKNRLQQPSQQSSRQMVDNMGRPPSLDYVPYVRTDEVYHMDPMASHSRPSTQETQQRVNIARSRQVTPLVQHDPSHPKSTERQQAILKGLSELRQGLLLKQRELETSLNPLLQTQQKQHFPPFRPCEAKLL
ncbi:coiled-coil domain-containing protein 66 isoform X2 [Triplophysa rosa]|uniref:coiled-coil domain-containing protein 66 isoform X2 n=1 Tax=Triplophysa rosa TaxID=992332 RepID=UPI002545DF1A|nr:coiled-coil domain-containing protein 66 isoform X2 [Triplophysa rosa]